jgi:hypothetical protein
VTLLTPAAAERSGRDRVGQCSDPFLPIFLLTRYSVTGDFYLLNILALELPEPRTESEQRFQPMCLMRD